MQQYKHSTVYVGRKKWWVLDVVPVNPEQNVWQVSRGHEVKSHVMPRSFGLTVSHSHTLAGNVIKTFW